MSYGKHLVQSRPRVKAQEAIAAYRRVLRLVNSYMWRNLDSEMLVAATGGLMTWGEIRHHVQCALAMRVTGTARRKG